MGAAASVDCAYDWPAGLPDGLRKVNSMGSLRLASPPKALRDIRTLGGRAGKSIGLVEQFFDRSSCLVEGFVSVFRNFM